MTASPILSESPAEVLNKICTIFDQLRNGAKRNYKSLFDFLGMKVELSELEPKKTGLGVVYEKMIKFYFAEDESKKVAPRFAYVIKKTALEDFCAQELYKLGLTKEEGGFLIESESLFFASPDRCRFGRDGAKEETQNLLILMQDLECVARRRDSNLRNLNPDSEVNPGASLQNGAVANQLVLRFSNLSKL